MELEQMCSRLLGIPCWHEFHTWGAEREEWDFAEDNDFLILKITGECLYLWLVC